MVNIIPPMYEYILWNNCSNNCKFCWQKKINNSYSILNNKEKTESIEKFINHINKQKNWFDLLVVGGELFEINSYEDFKIVTHLTNFLGGLILEKKIRYLYLNTNLLYKSLDGIISLINQLMSASISIETIKFTTSYDIYGRYENKERENLFLKNLRILTYSFPDLNVVVNMILTKQFCESNFDIKKFCNDYKVKVILVPYITLEENMRPTVKQVCGTFNNIENEIAGFIKTNILNFDIAQDRFLYEYNKKKKEFFFVKENNSLCGHNKNFTKVFKNNKCYICAIKELYYG